MRKVLGLAVGAAMMAAGPVQAAEWWYVLTSSTDEIYFVDAATIRSSGNIRTFWTQNVNKTLVKGAKYSKDFWEYDCIKRTSKPLSFVDISENGEIVRSNTFSLASENPIVPDSVAEGLLDFVCAPPDIRPQKLGAFPIDTSPREFADNYHRSRAPLDNSILNKNR